RWGLRVGSMPIRLIAVTAAPHQPVGSTGIGFDWVAPGEARVQIAPSVRPEEVPERLRQALRQMVAEQKPGLGGIRDHALLAGAPAAGGIGGAVALTVGAGYGFGAAMPTLTHYALWALGIGSVAMYLRMRDQAATRELTQRMSIERSRPVRR